MLFHLFSSNSYEPQSHWYKHPIMKYLWIFLGFNLLLVGVIIVLYFKTDILTLFGKGPQKITDIPPTYSREELEKVGNPTWGNPDAKTTIVYFNDFTNIDCQKNFNNWKQLIKKYDKEIYFIYRDLPLTSLDQNAFNTALAIRCADEQGVFSAYFDRLFLSTDDLSVSALKQYAEKLGLNKTKFETCLNTKKYSTNILNDMLLAQSAGVNFPPTYFVNGYKIEGQIPLDAWDLIIPQFSSTQN